MWLLGAKALKLSTRVIQFLEAQSRRVVTGERGQWGRCLMGTEFQFCKLKRILKVSNVKALNIIEMYIQKWLNGKFCVCVFYHTMGARCRGNCMLLGPFYKKSPSRK